jgi:hypothetical protein
LRLKPTIAFEKAGAPAPLLGDPGCFTRADNGWAAGLCVTDRFIKNTHEVLSPLAELTAHARLVKFAFLTADRAVRQATYRDEAGQAVTVTVNFGQASYTASSKLGQSVSLPTWGFLVEAPTFVAFHATSWAGRSYQETVLFTIRLADHQALIFHGFGDAHLMWQGQALEVPRETVVGYAAGEFPADSR